MPFEIMDQRGVSASSHFFDEICFPAERQVGFRKPKTMPDHQGTIGMLQMPGTKSVSSSPLERFLPIGARSVDYLELQQSFPARNQKEKLHVGGEEGTANYSRSAWRLMDRNPGTRSNFYVQPASYSVDGKKTDINGTQYESSLFSSSLSEIFSQKFRLSANDVLFCQSADTVASRFEEEEPLESLEEIEAQTIGNLLPDEDDLFSGVIDELGSIAHVNGFDDFEDFDLFSSGGGMELEGDDRSCVGQKNSDFSGGILINQEGSNGSIVSEHPHGEHPSRTLFVRNINSNVEDSELKVLFEQYG
ncbi:hypothetical protein L1049_027418 [Liquidambar formosana]|uniref:Uncharacterized protein n=1 Tax=Liquidambar formosana TaxID=63359 RepID=A0AAP0RKP4_LIQFO